MTSHPSHFGLEDHDADFTVDHLDYVLPDSLIAQHPAPHREDARLLLVDRGGSSLADRSIGDLPDLLAPGDLLVLNDSRVLPARFLARRATGGRVPGLFVEEESPGLWRVMLQGAGRLRPGTELHLMGAEPSPPGMCLLERLGEGHWRVELDRRDSPEVLLAQFGETPLPPYIRRAEPNRAGDPEDRQRYQTVYARHAGSIAAPTAGLHFTDALLARLRDRGIHAAFVTLHVGVGTFKPLTVSRIQDHVMHAERFEVTAETLFALRDCRQRRGRIVAVGTTSARVLETAAATGALERAGARSQHHPSPSSSAIDRPDDAVRGSTKLFIYPPYRFQLVDALLTNFHLPRSTLLALVMALAGKDLTRRAYSHAVEQRYRFYSYGDAMLVL